MKTSKSRPYSYSESSIDVYKPIDTNFSIQSSDYVEHETIIIPKKSSNYIFSRLVMFVFHLLLISFFEIVFFLNVIVKYENLAFYNLADNFIIPITSSCSNTTPDEKIIFTDIYNMLFNMTVINNNAQVENTSRIIFNRNIIILAWMYFSILFILLSILLIINYIFKKGVNLKKILVDNIFMIMFLGLFEYMFFNTVIIPYKNIDTNTITQYIANQLATCK